MSGPTPGNLKLAGSQACRQPHSTPTQPTRVLGEPPLLCGQMTLLEPSTPCLPCFPRHHPPAPPLPTLGRRWRAGPLGNFLTWNSGPCSQMLLAGLVALH